MIAAARRGLRAKERSAGASPEAFSLSLSLDCAPSFGSWANEWTISNTPNLMHPNGKHTKHAALARQELGEGLTLAGAKPAAGQQAGEPHWPMGLQQLERLRAEAAKVSALAGQNVILNCAVQFADGHERPFVVNWLKYPDKLPIYIWYAGYPAHVAAGYESRLGRLGQASLNLSQVRESDQGLYECKIYFLDRGGPSTAAAAGQQRPEPAAHQPSGAPNGTWVFLDVQGELFRAGCSLNSNRFCCCCLFYLRRSGDKAEARAREK